MSYIRIRYTDGDGIDREVTRAVKLTDERQMSRTITAAADWFFRTIGHPINYEVTLIDKRITDGGDGTPRGYGRRSIGFVRAR